MKIVFLTVIAVIDLFLGMFVFMNGYRKIQNRYFAAIAVSAIIWTIGDLLMLFSPDPKIVQSGAFLFLVGPLFVSLFVLLFSLNFPESSRRNLIQIIGFSLPTLAVSLLVALHQEFLITYIRISQTQNIITFNQLGYTVYGLYFLIYFLIYSSVLYLRVKNSINKRIRKQVYYVFLSILSTTFVAFIPNLLVPIFFQNSLYVWIGPLSSASFAGFVGIAILKHKLLDIRLVVARSLAYVFSLSILLAIYGGIFSALTIGLASVFESSLAGNVLSIVILCLAAVTYAPLKRVFDKVTNRFFYQDAYDSRAFFNQLNKVLVGTVDLEVLLSKVSAIIVQNMKMQYCAFVLSETAYTKTRIIGVDTDRVNKIDIQTMRNFAWESHSGVIATGELSADNDDLKQYLQKYEVEVVARLTFDQSLKSDGLGFLTLGPKKSGNAYNSKDIETIETIANELVIAIQNALRFEEIEKFNITLQEKVDDATLRLRKTNDKLKTMDETKDEFISMASHQLRTPLTSIKGYLSMVLEGDAGDVSAMQRKLLDQAFISSQRMVYLIADLLNVSRLHTGKFILEPVATNLADVVEGEVNQLHDTAASRGVTIAYNKPENFSVLMLDETKVRQVIMNFLDNAIYYTQSGNRIDVELKETDKTVEYTVTDDGIGVPKSEQHHLFTKFYRAGNAKKARPDGTGLGLFMAKKVIVAQGGSIIFKSAENKGSTFGFSFPKAKLLPNPPEPLQ